MTRDGLLAGERVPTRDRPEPGVPAVLVLCTANVCRSPMAAALLRRRLAQRGRVADVSSAGLLAGGRPALPVVLTAMERRGFDLSGHLSHTVTRHDLSSAALVVAMTREHLRHAVVMVPTCWPQAFTLKELVRRGGQAGGRGPDEPLAAWLARVHDGRARDALMGASPADDVADPVGGPPEAVAATADLLDVLTAQLAGLCWDAVPA